VDSRVTLAIMSAVKNHPAFAIYERLFAEAAADDSPTCPSGFVHESHFHRALIEAGIECPAGFVAFSDWCESIGVPQFVHRLIMRHHSSRGTSPSPYERMGARQHRMLRRLQTD
jgi:hypothetical protein